MEQSVRFLQNLYFVFLINIVGVDGNSMQRSIIMQPSMHSAALPWAMRHAHAHSIGHYTFASAADGYRLHDVI